MNEAAQHLKPYWSTAPGINIPDLTYSGNPLEIKADRVDLQFGKTTIRFTVSNS